MRRLALMPRSVWTACCSYFACCDMGTLCCCMVGYLWEKCSLVLQTIEWDVWLLFMQNSQKAWKCPVQLKRSETERRDLKRAWRVNRKESGPERLCLKPWWWRRGAPQPRADVWERIEGQCWGEIRQEESRASASQWSCCVLSRCVLPGTGSGSLDTDFKGRDNTMYGELWRKSWAEIPGTQPMGRVKT